jgi:hypothetical protein
MTYLWRSPAGTFTIEPDETASDTVKLCVGGLWLASFGTAEEAAGAVIARQTGWPDWDCSCAGECPACLAEWEGC